MIRMASGNSTTTGFERQAGQALKRLRAALAGVIEAIPVAGHHGGGFVNRLDARAIQPEEFELSVRRRAVVVPIRRPRISGRILLMTHVIRLTEPGLNHGELFAP